MVYIISFLIVVIVGGLIYSSYLNKKQNNKTWLEIIQENASTALIRLVISFFSFLLALQANHYWRTKDNNQKELSNLIVRKKEEHNLLSSIKNDLDINRNLAVNLKNGIQAKESPDSLLSIYKDFDLSYLDAIARYKYDILTNKIDARRLDVIKRQLQVINNIIEAKEEWHNASGNSSEKLSYDKSLNNSLLFNLKQIEVRIKEHSDTISKRILEINSEFKKKKIDTIPTIKTGNYYY